MANFYWVGGAGNWTDYAAHWATASGGSTFHANAPTSADNVFIDNNSGTGTITVNAIANMLDLTFGTISAITLSNAAYAFNVYGNLTLPASNLTVSFTSTGYLYFKSTSTGKTITSNGNTSSWNRIYFDGVGGEWTMQDNWSVGGSDLYVANGTFTLNSKTLTTTNSIWSVNGGSKIFNLGGTLNVLNFRLDADVANITVNHQNGTINVSSSSFLGGGKSYYNVNLTRVSGVTIDNSTIYNLTRSSTAQDAGFTLLLSGSPTITNSFTCSGFNSSNGRLLIASNTIGTARTITCNGTITASNVDFRDITGAGSASWNLSAITGGSGDCGGNSGIIFTPSQTLYFKHTSGAVNLSDSSKWFTTDGGSTLGRTPLPQDYAYFTANSFAGTSTITFNMPRFCGIDMSGVNQAVTLSQNIAIEFYGDYILDDNIITSFISSSGVLLFGKSGVECKLNTYTKSIRTLYIYRNVYRNYSDINLVSAFRLGQGTFYLNGFNLSCSQFQNIDNVSGNYGGYFYAGSGTITNNGSIFLIYRNIFIAETSTIIMNNTETTDITISIGSIFGSLVTINKLILQGTITGNYIISQGYGSTTINELTINAGKKVKFEGGRTFSVGKITAKGTNTNKIIIGSTTTTKANITYTGGIQPDIKFADISYINATNAFKVRASTDSGNNTNITFNPAKFWVGGTGNINDTAHWSDTSGGAGGAVLPTLTDDVFFDENSLGSDGQTITINAAFDCLSLDFEYLVNTMTLTNAVYNLSVYGGLFLSTKLTASFSSTGYLYLKSTTSVPIYSNSNASSWNRIYFDGVGGTWTNQDDWNAGTSTWIYLANGTLKLNTKTLTTYRFYFATGTKVLDISDSTLVSTNSIDFNDYRTNATILANNSLIRLQDNSAGHFGFVGGGFLLNNIEIIQPNTAIYGTIVGIYCNNLTLSGALHNFRPTYTHTINNNLTIVGNNSTNYRAFLNSETIGSQATITCNGTVIASNVDFRDITGAGTANWDLSAITGGSGDCGGNSGITFTSAQKQYFKHTSGAVNFSDSTKWFSDFSPRTTAGRVPLPQDDWDMDASSFTGTSTVSVNCPRIGKSCDMSGVNQAVTWSLANAIECYGSYVLGSNITVSGSQSTYLVGNASFDLNTYERTIGILRIQRGTYILQSNFNGSYIYSYSTASFDANDFNVTITAIQQFTQFQNLWLGNGIWTLNLNIADSAYLNPASNLYAEGSTIKLNPASGSSNITFAGGGKTFNKVRFSGSHTGNFDITGNNTFAELIIDAGRKVRFTAGTTQQIAKATIGSGATISSVTNATHTLNYTGSEIVETDGITISYSTATPANKWYAGATSTDAGNNSGWLFESLKRINAALDETQTLAATLESHSLISDTQFTETEDCAASLIADAAIISELSENETLESSTVDEVFAYPELLEQENLNSTLVAEFLISAILDENENIICDLFSDAILIPAFSESEIMAAEVNSPSIVVHKAGEIIIVQSNIQTRYVAQSNLTTVVSQNSNVQTQKTMYSKIF